MGDIDNSTIELAKEGDAPALETIIRQSQGNIYRLAMRMLADPQAAQDATQEILIRLITKLSTFNGESRFETWVYRVATNYLLTARKIIAKDAGLSFQMFSDDLLNGLADERHKAPEDHVMINELRIRCTMAMLLCLDRDQRAAYVLGEVLEFDHAEAAAILEITPANFRQRLSRSRSKVQEFTKSTCGLAEANAACSCSRRLPAAMEMGRIGASPSAELRAAPSFAEVKALAESTQADIVAAKLQRATGPLTPSNDYAAAVLGIITPY